MPYLLRIETFKVMKAFSRRFTSRGFRDFEKGQSSVSWQYRKKSEMGEREN